MGGAIYAPGAVTSDDCDFIANTSGSNGGAIYSDSQFVASESLFRDNQARMSGGAVRCGYSGSVTASAFESNRCINSSGECYGGAIRCVNGTNSGPMSAVQFVGNYVR